VINAGRPNGTVWQERDRMKLRSKLLNARWQCENVSQNNEIMKLRSKLLNARRLCLTAIQEINRMKLMSKVLYARRPNGTVWQERDRMKLRSKLLNARRLIGTVWEGNVRKWDIDHWMIAEIVTYRTWQMSLIVQQRKQNNFYTGHGIQQTPISIGQLCVSYVIVSSLAQKPFTNLPRKTLGHTVEDLVSKVMKSTTKPH
jgi:hypothetical protein